jgi:hypothetical protein
MLNNFLLRCDSSVPGVLSAVAVCSCCVWYVCLLVVVNLCSNCVISIQGIGVILTLVAGSTCSNKIDIFDTV